MSRLLKLRPSPALVVALAAFVVATSGAALALPGKNSVSRNDIKKGAVNATKIARGAVGSLQIKGKSIRGNRLKDKAVKAKQIADGTITSAQVAADGLNGSDIADYEAIGPVKAAATDHASEAAGRTDSPAVPLFAKGQLTIEAKCFRETGGDVFAEIYVKTSANGAILTSSNGTNPATLPGGAAADFLNTDTPPLQRQLVTAVAPSNGGAIDNGTFAVTSADGRQLVGQTSVAAKNGTLAGGDGPYGAGNVCLFGLQVSG